MLPRASPAETRQWRRAGVHPAALLQRVLPLLAPSAALAVWCPFLQPLADAMQELQARPPARCPLQCAAWGTRPGPRPTVLA